MTHNPIASWEAGRLARALAEGRSRLLEVQPEDREAVIGMLVSGFPIESMCATCHGPLKLYPNRVRTSVGCSERCRLYYHNRLKRGIPPGYEVTLQRQANAERRAMLALCASLAPIARKATTIGASHAV